MSKVIKGDDNDNTIHAISADGDYLFGMGGDDTLIGGGGADKLDGGTGNDVMIGGGGDDYYWVDSASDMVIENANGGHDIVQSTVTYSLGANVEDLALVGDDDLDGYGNSLDNNISGNDGDNHLYGGAGKDTLLGNAGNDHLYGGNGDDILNGGEGSDVMMGGLNNDTYYVDQLSDVVVENKNEGHDTVHSTITYTLGANVEDLTLDGTANLDGAGNGLDNVITGNSGNNMLFGYDGADTLDGGAGADTLFGGAGNDVYYIEGSIDHVIEHSVAGSGIDTVYSSGNYTMDDNVENLTLTGFAHMAFGNNLDNFIIGNNEDNYIDGRAGMDHLAGGGGHDTFVFRAGEANGDAIVDFFGNGAAAGDVMEFQGYGPGATFQQISGIYWQISSADHSIQDTIVLLNAPTIDASDWHFA